MKLDKKKVVFGSVITLVVLFIVGYATLVLGNNNKKENDLKETSVPKLDEGQVVYSSKKEAVDNIKEKRENNAPSLYDEKFMDSTGQFDPELLNKEKQRVIDSIYRLGRINYNEGTYRSSKKEIKKKDSIIHPVVITNNSFPKETALVQQLFFTVSPNLESKKRMLFLEVEVDGQQILKANDRLQMRVVKNTIINKKLVARNTILYGIVSFKPNRVLLTIDNISHQPIQLKAYDYADGLEGIYIKNSFRADATHEIMEDMVDDISIPGVPQVKGLKKVFQRTNRNVKVTVNNNYRLLLSNKK